MKITAIFFILTFILVIFPLFNSDALANFTSMDILPATMLSEPLHILLFGTGLLAIASNLRQK